MSGLGPVAAGLAAGGTSMVTTKGDLGRSLMAGLGAWGGAELGEVLGASGAGEMVSGSQATPWLNPDTSQLVGIAPKGMTENENWLTKYAPDMILHQTLLQAAPYLKNDERIQQSNRTKSLISARCGGQEFGV